MAGQSVSGGRAENPKKGAFPGKTDPDRTALLSAFYFSLSLRFSGKEAVFGLAVYWAHPSRPVRPAASAAWAIEKGKGIIWTTEQFVQRLRPTISSR